MDIFKKITGEKGEIYVQRKITLLFYQGSFWKKNFRVIGTGNDV